MKTNARIGHGGFTLIEVFVVMGIVAILFAIASQGLFNISGRASLTGTVTSFVADLRLQQLMSMSGTAEGGSLPDAYGVHMTTDRYILFKGSTYNALDANNHSVPIEAPIVITSVLFPSWEIIFASGSGDIVGFDPSKDTVTFVNSLNNEQKTVRFNSLGVPVGLE